MLVSSTENVELNVLQLSTAHSVRDVVFTSSSGNDVY